MHHDKDKHINVNDRDSFLRLHFWCVCELHAYIHFFYINKNVSLNTFLIAKLGSGWINPAIFFHIVVDIRETFFMQRKK